MFQGLQQHLCIRYGTRRGLLRHLLAKFSILIANPSTARSLAQIDFKRVDRIIFVCKGNICRSAYALAKALQTPSSVKVIQFESAGIAADTGNKANSVAIHIAQARNVDMTSHRARALQELTLGPSDLLLAFEPWQAAAIKKLAQENKAQVALAGLFLRSPMPHIEDPYGLSPEYFSTCFSRIDEIIECLAHTLSTSKSAEHTEAVGR